MRLLIEGQQRFLDEARDVLRAGLTQAAWITVDDTGARHKAANGTCTQIGNDHFAWFGTTASKSRLNFLELLRAGHGEYVMLPRDLVAGFEVGHSRQEPLHGGKEVGRIEAGSGRAVRARGMVLARARGKAAEWHQWLLVKSWAG